MPPRFTITVTGDKALLRKMATLRAAAQRGIARPAANYAWTPTNKAAQRGAPVETGALKASLGKQTKTYPKAGAVSVAITARVGEQWTRVDDRGITRKPWNYLHLVELGTGPPVPQPPNPFLRRAFDTTKNVAEQRFYRKAWYYIRKIARAA